MAGMLAEGCAGKLELRPTRCGAECV
jgi:hypothetical protein